MSVFERLLEVQERDTAADRLRHQRAHLPERAELAAVLKQAAEIDMQLAATRAELERVERRQATLESDVGAIDRRVRDIEKRMYSGEVSATRDLLAMTEEIQSLKRRCSSLEDDALAAMEEAEPLADRVLALERQRAQLDQVAEGIRSVIAAAEAEIDGRLGAEGEARQASAGNVPADLLATYETLRSRLGGIGAARMVGTSCSGCHLTLPASEVARIKREPPDTLVLCDQCGRILVR